MELGLEPAVFALTLGLAVFRQAVLEPALEPGLELAALEVAVFEIALGLAAVGLTLGLGAPLRLNSYPPVDGSLLLAHAPTCERCKPSFSA